MTPTLAPQTPAAWVSAPPFRAHLRHVADASGVPWQVLAMRAGVSLSLADHLLHGRQGRPVRRITRECAVRLLAVTPAVADAVRHEWVPADRAVGIVGRLVGQGWSPDAVAAAAGVERAAVRALAGAHPGFVQAGVELRLRALAAGLDRAVAGRDAA